MDWTCPLCGGIFGHRSSLKRHLKRRKCEAITSVDDLDDATITDILRRSADRNYDERLDDGFDLIELSGDDPGEDE